MEDPGSLWGGIFEENRGKRLRNCPVRFAACRQARSYRSKAKAGRTFHAGIGASVRPNACRSLRLIPASVRICDEIGANGHIPVKHLVNLNGYRYSRPIFYIRVSLIFTLMLMHMLAFVLVFVLMLMHMLALVLMLSRWLFLLSFSELSSSSASFLNA